jgi:hypothetical protein
MVQGLSGDDEPVRPGIGQAQGSTAQSSAMIWELIRGLHQGQQPLCCANRPDTWMHPTGAAIKTQPLCRRGRPHMAL